MPVVVALPALITALFLLALTYASLIFLRALLDSMGDSIPLVGGYIKRGLNAVVNAVVDKWNDWVGSHIAGVIHWLKGLESAIVDLPDALADFASRTVSTIDILWHHRVIPLVNSLANAVNAAVAAVASDVATAAHDIVGLGHRLTAEIKGLRDWATEEILRRALNGIDRLRSDVFDTAIPALVGGIDDALGALGQSIGFVSDLAGSIGADLGRLTRRIEQSLPWVETVAASVGAAVAIEALRRVVKCGSKIDRLCTTDENVLGDLLDTLLVVGAFSGLAAFTREAADALEQSLDAVKSLAE